MSKTLLAAAILAIIGISACKKEDVDPTVPNYYVDKGYIKFQNNSPDLYDIYLDDAHYGDIYGGDTAVYPRIPIGGHRVKAVQKEHVNGTAILRQQTIIVYKDSVTTFAFP
jgi:hypothetical protein